MTLQDWDRLRALYGDALIPLIEGLMKHKRHPTLHTVAFSKAIRWLHEDARCRFPQPFTVLYYWEQQYGPTALGEWRAIGESKGGTI